MEQFQCRPQDQILPIDRVLITAAIGEPSNLFVSLLTLQDVLAVNGMLIVLNATYKRIEHLSSLFSLWRRRPWAYNSPGDEMCWA